MSLSQYTMNELYVLPRGPGTSMSLRETLPNTEGNSSLSIIMNFMSSKGTRPIAARPKSLRETHPNTEGQKLNSIATMTEVIYYEADDDRDIIKFCKEGNFNGVKRCIDADSELIHAKEWVYF